MIMFAQCRAEDGLKKDKKKTFNSYITIALPRKNTPVGTAYREVSIGILN